MRALCFDSSLRVREVPAPEPGPGEALIRVTLAGICNTDIEIARGYMGFGGTLGHEFVGVVESCPSRPALVGRRVVGEINLGCGECPRCRRDLSRHCPHRSVLGILKKDGALAERVTLPIANLHEVPDDLPDEKAVFVEPLGAAFEILEQVRVEPGHRVAVLGDGKLGLLCAHVLAGAGCELWLAGKHPKKLAIAAAAGARVAAATEPLEGDFDVVVEATGAEQGLERALSLVRPRGTVVLKSTFHGAPRVETSRVVIDEVSVVGSRCGPFAPAIRAMSRGRVDPTPLIDATYPLSDAVAAFEHAQKPGVLKVLIRP